MLLADVAIRVMYLSLDFLSPLSISYQCLTRPPTATAGGGTPVIEEPEVVIEDDNTSLQQQEDDRGKNGAKTPGSLKPPSSRVGEPSTV